MKNRILFLLAIGFAWHPVAAQLSQQETDLLQKLDSLKKSQSVAKHFAELYFSTTVRATNYFLNRSQREQDFIRRFETRFAGFFFRSAEARTQNISIPVEWKTYFTGDELTPLQYQLIGINAHINGDIWQALTTEFSLAEIRENKDSYYSFQKGLILQYREFYVASRKSNSKIRTLHVATAGLDKLFGKMMLVRWRKRQLQLAVLYFNNRQKFDKKLEKLHQKMEHIDRMILQHL
ncbi:MAG TPA: DUF5995 family protein [Chitinophagaceae bacterium]|nr:DUF5995 family protein [Chitinophagaceae bacterium]